MRMSAVPKEPGCHFHPEECVQLDSASLPSSTTKPADTMTTRAWGPKNTGDKESSTSAKGLTSASRVSGCAAVAYCKLSSSVSPSFVETSNASKASCCMG